MALIAIQGSPSFRTHTFAFLASGGLELKRVVGCHSVVIDGNEGTDLETHVHFVDLDPKERHWDVKRHRVSFVADLRRAMQAHRLAQVHIFKTQKGYHLVSFEVGTLNDAASFQGRFRGWGADELHTKIGRSQQGNVLRLTEKPGPGGKIEYMETVEIPTNRVFALWSQAHYNIFQQAHGDVLPRPIGGRIHNRDVRLESYDVAPEPRSEQILLGVI